MTQPPGVPAGPAEPAQPADPAQPTGPAPAEFAWTLNPGDLWTAMEQQGGALGLLFRSTDPRSRRLQVPVAYRRNTNTWGALVGLAAFTVILFAVRAWVPAGIAAVFTLFFVGFKVRDGLRNGFAAKPLPPPPDPAQLLGQSMEFRLRLDQSGAMVWTNGAAQTHFWTEVRYVELTQGGLVLMCRVGNVADTVVAPVWALNAENVAAAKAVVEAYAPGRWRAA